MQRFVMVYLVVAVVLAALAALVVWLRRTYSVIRVDGDSMLPALAGGDRLLARRTTPAALRNGRIAVVRSPLREDAPPLIKRIAALPGDPVPASVRPIVPDTYVPAGHLVLIGDNTDASFDSREHGYFRIADIRAVTLRKLTSAQPVKSNPEMEKSP